jgi:glycosyltransferase involved in cell wall biosynthesis/GT2 family glycosyltransferase
MRRLRHQAQGKKEEQVAVGGRRLLFQRPSPAQIPTKSPEPRERADLAIQMRGPMLKSYSISHVLRNVALALHRSGIEVRWDSTEVETEAASYLGLMKPLQGPPVRDHIAMTWGWKGDIPAHDRQRGHFKFDCSDSFRPQNPEVVEAYKSSATDVVACFSDMCIERWAAVGVPREKIVKVPLGVDPLVFRPDGWRNDLTDQIRWWPGIEGDCADPFMFLVAGYLQQRKGVGEALEAYCRAFGPDDPVVFMVKGVRSAWGQEQSDLIENVLNRYSGHASVAYCGHNISKYEMAALLRRADCLINAHHMEGFGLVPLQAMACGTQVLVTDYHGPREYATQENALLLETTGEVAANERYPGIPEGVVWADYSIDRLADLMQEAMGGEGQSERIEAGLETVRQFSWDATAARLIEVIEERIGFLMHRPRKWFKRELVSVVFPVRNAGDKPERTVRTLFEATEHRPVEVVIFDDASEPGDARKLLEIVEEFEGIRLIRSDEHVGCFRGRQIAFEQAQGEFIINIDGDMDFSETRGDWISVLRRAMERHDAGIMHPLLVWPGRGEQSVQSAGGFIEGPFMCKHRYIDMPSCSDGVDVEVPLVCAPSALHFFKHDLLDLIGMDGDYFPAYVGDVDFCYAARAAGRPVWYCPEVTIIHDAGSWTKGEGKQMEAAYWPRNAELFLSLWGDIYEEDKHRQDRTGALRST